MTRLHRDLHGDFSNEEVASGSEVPRSLIRLVPCLQKNFLRALHSRSLMEGRVLFNLQGFATRYPLRGLPALPQGNPLPPFTIQNVDAGWGIYCYNTISTAAQYRTLRMAWIPLAKVRGCCRLNALRCNFAAETPATV